MALHVWTPGLVDEVMMNNYIMTPLNSLYTPIIFETQATNPNPISINGSGSPVAITWASPVTDRDSGWSATNASRYTFKTAGYYEADVDIGLAAGSGVIWSGYRINGTTPYVGLKNRGSTGSQVDLVGVHKRLPFVNVNDYVEVIVIQNGGTARNTDTSWQTNTFTLRWVGT